MNEGDVLDLTVETAEEGEFGFGAAVGLALIIDFLGDLLFEDLGGLAVVEDLVLAEREEGFEAELRERKANDKLLPREKRPIEEPREALREKQMCQLEPNSSHG